jgi:uncharacterized protein (TIGR00730 family)
MNKKYEKNNQPSSYCGKIWLILQKFGIFMQKIKTITVYASSSDQIDPLYYAAAADLGKRMASAGITCINGAGIRGLMAGISDAILANGGHVCGIIPRFMVEKGWMHQSIPEIIVTPDIHCRKQLMAQKSDACIALPGGVGTLEELLEIITWKQLGIYAKPVVILNVGGFYNDLISMLNKAIRENFIHYGPAKMYQIAGTPEEAMNLILKNDNVS